MLRKPKLHNSWSVALWSVRSDKKDERERERERESERARSNRKALLSLTVKEKVKG